MSSFLYQKKFSKHNRKKTKQTTLQEQLAIVRAVVLGEKKKKTAAENKKHLIMVRMMMMMMMIYFGRFGLKPISKVKGLELNSQFSVLIDISNPSTLETEIGRSQVTGQLSKTLS